MIRRAYRLLQHLSIDIVFGAVILLHFFSKIYGTSPSWQTSTLLGCSIWLIYTFDHLRDSRSAKLGNRERYTFHSRNQKALRIGMMVVFCLALTTLFFVPRQLILGGSILVVFSLVYVLFQTTFSRLGMKEAYIAIIYTLGVLLSPIVATQNFDGYSFIVLLILSFLNLIIFSWFEFEEDEADSFTSIATQMGKSNLFKLILAISSIGFAIAILSFDRFPMYAAYMLIVLVIFVLLVFNDQWAMQKSRYRKIGDAVFLLPILLEIL
ncbi:MAG: hypothetical protein ABJP45_06205 [Cyclobacteriaceae bacterium]